jgi:hypothetical protein
MDTDFNIDKDILKIVEILNRIIGDIITFDQKSKTLSIEIAKKQINDIDILNEQEQQSLFDKICEKIVFLYTEPIVKSPLTTSGNNADKIKSIFSKSNPIPFGIRIDRDKLPKNICDNESVKDLRYYYFNKLKILVYLSQLSNRLAFNDKYKSFYLKNSKNYNSVQIKNIKQEYNNWKNSINKIIQNVFYDQYPNKDLLEIIDRFTKSDPNTNELCKSITSVCQEDQESVCQNTNILSVSNQIDCNLVAKPESKQQKQQEETEETKLIEIKKIRPEKKEITSAKYKTTDDFINTVVSYFEDPNSNLNIPKENDDSICIGIKGENYEKFEPSLKQKGLNKEDRDQFITLLTLANSLYAESDNSLLDINEVENFKKNIDIISLDLNSINDIQDWISSVVGNEGGYMNQPKQLEIQLPYYCKIARVKPKFKFLRFDNCNVDILTQSIIYITRGDGNCLLHAFLMTISPEYRKASGELKQAIADQFRQILINKNQTRKSKSEIAELKRLENFDALKNEREFLTDDTIKFISENFKINIFYFSYDNRLKPVNINLFDLKLSRSKKSKQYVCIFYAGSHFSGVSMNVGLTKKNSTDNFRILESPTNDPIIKKYTDKLSLVYQ